MKILSIGKYLLTTWITKMIDAIKTACMYSLLLQIFKLYYITILFNKKDLTHRYIVRTWSVIQFHCTYWICLYPFWVDVVLRPSLRARRWWHHDLRITIYIPRHIRIDRPIIEHRAYHLNSTFKILWHQSLWLIWT